MKEADVSSGIVLEQVSGVSRFDVYTPKNLSQQALITATDEIVAEINTSDAVKNGDMTERSPQWVTDKLQNGQCVFIVEQATGKLASFAFLEYETNMFSSGEPDVQICAVKTKDEFKGNGAGALAFKGAADLANKLFPGVKIVTWVHEESERALKSTKGIGVGRLKALGKTRNDQRQYFLDRVLDDIHSAYLILPE